MANPYVAGAGGTAAVGAVAGRGARGKDTMVMDQDVQRDLDSLLTTGSLPHGVQPAFSLTPRRQRGIVSRYLLGIGLGGFGAWLVTLVIAVAVIEGTGQEGAAAEKVIPSLMVAALVGFGGFIIPGLLIGAWLWIRESRARIREATAETYRMYWAERERGSAALAQGQATPDQVAEVLFRFHTDSMPDPAVPPSGSWHGEVGERIPVVAEVELIGAVPGSDDPSHVYTVYYLRTAERDLVTWQAREDYRLLVGDVVTLDAQVKAHSVLDGERQTEVFYCQVLERARPSRES